MKKVIAISLVILFLLSLLYFIYLIYLKYKIFFVNEKSNFKLKNLNKKNILIFTIETRDLKILDIHNKNISDYAEKHNYKYIFIKDYKNSLELPVYWWKIQCMLDYLNSNKYDYVLWLDSDAFFIDYEIPLESLLEMSPESSIYIGKDLNPLFNIYCAGVFIVKNDKIGKEFLSDCINTYINTKSCKVDNKYTLNSEWAGDCYEQGVMNKLLKTKYKKNVFIIPNSFVLNHSKISENTVISHIFGDKDNTYNEITKFLENKNLKIK